MLSLNSDGYSGLRFNLRLISLEEGSMNLIITNPCKKKKKYIAIRTVPKTNRNKLIPLSTPIYDRLLSWLCTGTLQNSCMFNLVI